MPSAAEQACAMGLPRPFLVSRLDCLLATRLVAGSVRLRPGHADRRPRVAAVPTRRDGAWPRRRLPGRHWTHPLAGLPAPLVPLRVARSRCGGGSETTMMVAARHSGAACP